MDSIYTFALSAHVVTAILGLGQIAGTAVLATSTPSDAPLAPATLVALRRLGRGTTWALALMLLSGALVEYATGGAFHGTWWFRLSVLLLVTLGALQGGVRRALRKLVPAADGGALRGVARISWAMCAIVAAAAILMEAKPW